MTAEQIKKTLTRIQQLDAEIAALKQARTEIALNGYASATMSSAGGSRSYTRLDLDKLSAAIAQLERELKQLRNLLFRGSDAGSLRQIYTVYS